MTKKRSEPTPWGKFGFRWVRTTSTIEERPIVSVKGDRITYISSLTGAPYTEDVDSVSVRWFRRLQDAKRARSQFHADAYNKAQREANRLLSLMMDSHNGERIVRFNEKDST